MMCRISLFLLASFFAIASCQDYNWTRVWGTAVQVSAKGDRVWALNRNHNMHRLVNHKWVPFWGGCNHVAATIDDSVWMVEHHGYGAFRCDNNNADAPNWAQLGEDEKLCFHLNAYSASSAICVAAGGKIWRYDNGWQQLPGRGAEAAIGENGEIWMVDFNSRIFRYANNGWEPMPGMATHIDVQSKDKVVITDHRLNAYQWNDGSWKLLSGVACVQATINKKSVYCVDPYGAIYQLDL